MHALIGLLGLWSLVKHAFWWPRQSRLEVSWMQRQACSVYECSSTDYGQDNQFCSEDYQTSLSLVCCNILGLQCFLQLGLLYWGRETSSQYQVWQLLSDRRLEKVFLICFCVEHQPVTHGYSYLLWHSGWRQRYEYLFCCSSISTCIAWGKLVISGVSCL